MCEKCSAQSRALLMSALALLATSPEPVIATLGRVATIIDEHSGVEEVSDELEKLIATELNRLDLKQTVLLSVLAHNLLTTSADTFVNASAAVIDHGIETGASAAIGYTKNPANWMLPTLTQQPALVQKAIKLMAMDRIRSDVVSGAVAVIDIRLPERQGRQANQPPVS